MRIVALAPGTVVDEEEGTRPQRVNNVQTKEEATCGEPQRTAHLGNKYRHWRGG